MRNIKAIALFSVLSLMTPVTFAAGTGWYVGAGGGWTDARGGANAIDPDLTEEGGTVTNLDDNDTGWKVFGGYQFTSNFAVEASYVKMGKFSVDANITNPLGTESAEVKPDAWCAAGVGTLPLQHKFSLLGKLGICRWDDHSHTVETIAATPATMTMPAMPEMRVVEEPETTGTDIMFGLGAKYDFTSNVGARLEWERYTNVIHNNNDVDLWSVSLQYSF